MMIWLTVAITATVAYHLILKLTPAGVNPLLSLSVTYLIGAGMFALIYAFSTTTEPLGDSLRLINWTALLLAVAVVGLDIGYLMLYRSGFDVSLGQLVTQSAASLVLVIVGVAVFREKLTLVNVGGIALCVVGLWLINRR